MLKADNPTSRRRLLKATTALSVLAAPAIARAASSAAPSDDRLVALWERWEQTNAHALATLDAEAAEPLWRALDKIENAKHAVVGGVRCLTHHHRSAEVVSVTGENKYSLAS